MGNLFTSGYDPTQLAADAAAAKASAASADTLLKSSSFGLSALKTGIDAIKTVVDASKAALESASYGLSALKTKLDAIEGTVNTIHGNTAATRNTVDNIWGASYYGLVDARNEAVWGRVAIRNRVEDAYVQAQAANGWAQNAKDNAWHAIDARLWIHAATYGQNAWSLPEIRALLDDIRTIAMTARDNAAAANSNAAAANSYAAVAAGKVIPTKATALTVNWSSGYVETYSLGT